MSEIPMDDRLIKRIPAEIGCYLTNIDLNKALQFLNEGMIILPNERFCILKRAIARKKAMYTRAALDDVTAALRLDPHDLRAYAINNEILYLRKHFEKALILNNQLSKQRTYPDDFSMGQMKCMIVVLNTVHHEHCGHPLRDHYEIIRQQAWEKATSTHTKKFKSSRSKKRKLLFPSNTDLSKQRPVTPKTKIDQAKEIISNASKSHGTSATSFSQDISDDLPDTEMWENAGSKWKPPKLLDFPYRPLQERTSNIENFLSEKYLQKLHSEKLFLKQLITQKSFDTPNKKNEEKIRQLIHKCHKHLCSLQELLRSLKPFYYIKYQEQKNATRAVERRKRIQNRHREETNQAFVNIYRRLKLAFDTRNLKTLMIAMENLVELYGNLPKMYIDEHQKNIIESFKLLRDGQFSFGLFSPGMSEEEKINRVKAMLGIEMQTTPSKDSFYNSLRHFHPTDWHAKIKITEERLKKARFQTEIIYFNYELARFHLELGRTDFAHSFARRCIKNARENGEMKWIINAQLLMAKANIRNKNRIDALKSLEKCISISRTINSFDMIKFLTLALEIVRKIDFTPALNARGVILKRQKQILNLLKDNNENRMKAEILFKKLSFTPAKRTMSMIPGIKIIDDIQSEKTYRKRAKSAKATTSHILEKKKGIGFYDNIRDFMEV